MLSGHVEFPHHCEHLPEFLVVSVSSNTLQAWQGLRPGVIPEPISGCQWKNVACHIRKQKMLQPSSHYITTTPMVNPEGTQDRNRMPTIKPSTTASTPQQCTLRRLKMRKQRILAPDSWGAYQRNDFIEPRILNLPIHRKALNSLTWDVWFSLINSNLLKFQVPGLCCKDSYMPWLLPYIFRAVPQSYPRDCVLGLSPQFCLPNKT